MLRALQLTLDLEISSDATRRLAATLALQSIDQLKRPPWSLVREPEDVPLYEALVGRFPKPTPQDAYPRKRAESIYLISLIAHNRAREAVAFLVEKHGHTGENGSLLDRELTDYLVRQGLVRQVRDFLREALSTDPAAPYWSDFIELSARVSEADKALAFLREIVARPNLSPEARETTNQFYANALLAADQVDDGLKVLRALVQAGPRAGTVKTDDAEAEIKKNYDKAGVQVYPELLAELGGVGWRGRPDNGMEAFVGYCLKLARIGHLLGRPELVDEGVAAAKQWLGKASPNKDQGSNGTEELLAFLVSANRGPEAEQLLIAEMVHAAKPSRSPYGLFQMGALTEKLACLYHRVGRQEDVLKLLDESPSWSQPDLASLANEEQLSVPVLFVAARALATAGHKDEARRLAERLLEHKGGYDPAYALLLELGGDGLEAQLDALARRDRFEERPLIWKAKLQLAAGRTDEAEKTVRAAIAIDPSDGEEGKGDRMRAYAVLGDVLEKKGDMEQAKIMRGAVAAIRLSEDADDWWEAGLLTRAVKMYEEALGHFADAYCIQSRLALRYSELGDYDKAELHYRRAFELMPDSFGRIESHCFGCEGAFSGDRAQNIAERVFTRLTVETPTKPQVFYLLGYLRQEQSRWGTAAMQFRQAVTLDPDYFNAWERLYSLPEDAGVSQEDIQAAVLAMLRLDPGVHHHNADFRKVRNLAALWDGVLAAEKARPPLDRGPIYSLAATKIELERRRKAAGEAMAGEAGVPDFEMMNESAFLGRGQAENIRSHFVEHPLLRTVANILDMFAMRR